MERALTVGNEAGYPHSERWDALIEAVAQRDPQALGRVLESFRD